MGKGTPSKGKKNKAASHKKHYCASCGFGRSAKLRKPSWRNRYKAFSGNKGFYR